MEIFYLLIVVIQFAFVLYRNPEKAKGFFNLLVLKISPLVFSIITSALTIAMFALSPLAFSLTEKKGGLMDAYGTFFLFSTLAILGFFVSKFLYRDFLKTKIELK